MSVSVLFRCTQVTKYVSERRKQLRFFFSLLQTNRMHALYSHISFTEEVQRKSSYGIWSETIGSSGCFFWLVTKLLLHDFIIVTAF